jgi:hypothetical protein
LANLESDLQTWLTEFGFNFIKQNDPNSQFHFGLPTAFGTVLNIDVIKDKNKPVIVVGLAIGVSDQHRQVFASFSNDEKKKFVFDLQTKLLNLGLDFTFRPNAIDPQQIEILDMSVSDGFSKTDLLNGLRKIRNAGLYIIWLYGNRFSTDATPSSSSQHMYG